MESLCLVLVSSCSARLYFGILVESVGMVKNMSGCVPICCVTSFVKSLTWRRRYNRKASLLHLPSSMLVEVLTFAKYRSIAQLERREWVPTDLTLIPSFVSPTLSTCDMIYDLV